MAGLTEQKAKKILKDKTVRGEPLTGKQKKFFGFVAGGEVPDKTKQLSALKRSV